MRIILPITVYRGILRIILPITVYRGILGFLFVKGRNENVTVYMGYEGNIGEYRGEYSGVGTI